VLAALTAYAVLSVAVALGWTPSVLGSGPAILDILVVPFALGAFSPHPWLPVAVFAIVLGTALLPDRTVVETSRGWITSTTYATAFAPTFGLAVVSGLCAYVGASMRLRRNAVA
jgi:hypothetical protein